MTKNKITTKDKAKVVGVRQFADTETGEMFSAEVILKETADANFKKIWIHHILEAIDEIGNAKMKVLFWLMEQADNQNRVIGTVRGFAKETGTSPGTIQSLLTALQKANVLKREFNGVWQLNPDVVWKGSHGKRMDVLIRYRTQQLELPFEENVQPSLQEQAA